MRWINLAEMPDQPAGWYWSAFPGAWIWYDPKSGMISSTMGDTEWHQLQSLRYFGPWQPLSNTVSGRYDLGKQTNFRAMAVRVLRQHVRCGDQYPDDGWPEVNEALAQYAIEQRQRNPRPHHGSGSGWCRCLLDTEEE